MKVVVPEINPELITVNKYKIGNKYTDERTSLHEEIIFVKLNKEPSNEKRAILLGGGSGAGKTTIIEEAYLNKSIDDSDFIYIDSDEIKNYIPEYREYRENEETIVWAAFYVHKESTDITDKLIDTCIKRGLSFIYDGTMSWLPHYEELLSKLKSAEYRTIGVYVDVDVSIALDRVKKRASVTKRYVPDDIVKQNNRNSAINFRILEKEFSEVLMYNNDDYKDSVQESLSLQPFYCRQHIPKNGEEFSGDILNDEQFYSFKRKSELPPL